MLSTISMQQSGASVAPIHGNGRYTVAYAPSHGRPSILRPDAEIFQPPTIDEQEASSRVAWKIEPSHNTADGVDMSPDDINKTARRSTVGPSDSVSQVMFSGLRPSEYTSSYEPDSQDEASSTSQLRGGATDSDTAPELVDDTSDNGPTSVSSCSVEYLSESASKEPSDEAHTLFETAIMEQECQRKAATRFLSESAERRAANANKMLDIFATMINDATHNLSADQQAFQQTIEWVRGQIRVQESQEHHAMTPVNFDIYEELPELIASLAGIENARKQRNLVIQRIHHKRFAAAENAQRLSEDRVSDIDDRIRTYCNRHSNISRDYISSVAAPLQSQSTDQETRPASKSDPLQLSSQDVVKTLRGTQPKGGKKTLWYDLCRERFWVPLKDGGEVAEAL